MSTRAKRWRQGAALAVLLVPAAAALAQSANLSTILELARRSDAQFAAAQSALVASREKRDQAKSLFRPTITINGNARTNNDYSSLTSVRANYNSQTATITGTQPLLRLQNLEVFAQSELQAQAAEQQFRQAEQDLLLRVSKGYFEVLQAQDALATLGAQKVAIGQQVAQTRRSFEVGTVPITDVDEAQSRFDLTVAQEIAARNELEVKRRALARIIDREPPALAPLRANAPLSSIEQTDLARWVERAPEDNAAVLVARLNREVAAREIRRQRVADRPTLDLVASIGTSRNIAAPGSLQRYDTQVNYVGLELAWPLYQGGAIGPRVREAVANLGKSDAELDSARRQAAFEARQALLGVQSGAALVRALEQALSSSQRLQRSTQRGFEVGVRARIDVLNAEQQGFTTQRDLSAARYQTLLASLQLRAAANALTEQELRDIDAWLAP